MPTHVLNIYEAPPGWKELPNFAYVGNSSRAIKSKFGNPFSARSNADQERESALLSYQDYIDARIGHDEAFAEDVRLLSGKTLVCNQVNEGLYLASAADRLQHQWDLCKSVEVHTACIEKIRRELGTPESWRREKEEREAAIAIATEQLATEQQSAQEAVVTVDSFESLKKWRRDHFQSALQASNRLAEVSRGYLKHPEAMRG